MTDKQINIAIAKSLGWTRIEMCNIRGLIGSDKLHGTPPCDKNKPVNDQWTEEVPNYTEDLNAMNTVESLLTDSQCQRYFDKLEEVTGATLKLRGKRYGVRHYDMYSAKARQRAEAYLRAIGKWVES